MEKLRICFAGTPAFAAAHLSRLLQSDHKVIAVYSQPDRPSGRGKKLHASPVKAIALENSIPCLQPVSLKSVEAEQQLRELNIDVLVVVAYGLILPQQILDIPKFGCVNVHASLLPRWRGAAPIERSILAGDKVTGVTIMQMDEGLDTGDMLNKVQVTIEDTDNRVDIEDKLIEAGSSALVTTLNQLSTFRENAEVQNDADTCYATKLDKSESLINWGSPASEIDRQVRASIGITPAFSYLNQNRMRVIQARPIGSATDLNVSHGTIVACSKDSFEVQTAEGLLEVSSVQLPGKSATHVRDVLNSRPELFAPGNMFANSEEA